MTATRIIDLGAALRNALGVTTPEDDPPVRDVDLDAKAREIAPTLNATQLRALYDVDGLLAASRRTMTSLAALGIVREGDRYFDEWIQTDLGRAVTRVLSEGGAS